MQVNEHSRVRLLKDTEKPPHLRQAGPARERERERERGREGESERVRERATQRKAERVRERPTPPLLPS